MDTGTLAIFFTSAIAIISQIATFYRAWTDSQTALETKRMELDEAKRNQELHLQESYRRERIQRLDKLMADLRDKRGQLQYWQDKKDSIDVIGATKTSEILYGDAYGIMLSVGDDQVTEAAEIMIHPDTHFTDKVKEISRGLKRMAEIVNGLYDK